MKENRDLYYIAALADGEIKDPSLEQKLRDEIRNNPDLQFEYFVQTSIKNLVSTRLKVAPAPVKVRQRLERKISPRSEKSLTSRLLPEIYFRKPAFAWGGTLVVILAVVLTLLNLPPVPEYKNFAVGTAAETQICMYRQGITLRTSLRENSNRSSHQIILKKSGNSSPGREYCTKPMYLR